MTTEGENNKDRIKTQAYAGRRLIRSERALMLMSLTDGQEDHFNLEGDQRLQRYTYDV